MRVDTSQQNRQTRLVKEMDTCDCDSGTHKHHEDFKLFVVHAKAFATRLAPLKTIHLPKCERSATPHCMAINNKLDHDACTNHSPYLLFCHEKLLLTRFDPGDSELRCCRGIDWPDVKTSKRCVFETSKGYTFRRLISKRVQASHSSCTCTYIRVRQIGTSSCLLGQALESPVHRLHWWSITTYMYYRMVNTKDERYTSMGQHGTLGHAQTSKVKPSHSPRLRPNALLKPEHIFSYIINKTERNHAHSLNKQSTDHHSDKLDSNPDSIERHSTNKVCQEHLVLLATEK